MNKELTSCVFLWLVAFHEDKKYLLLQHRSDGLFGTPGGKVDAGEDLATALIREIAEEANITDIVSDLSDVLELGVFDSHNYLVHSYVKEISYSYMKTIRANYLSATHSEEVAGMSILELNSQTIANLVKLPFAGSGNKEINLVLDFLNIKAL